MPLTGPWQQNQQARSNSFFAGSPAWLAQHFDRVGLNSELGRAAELMRQDVAEAYVAAVRRDVEVS